MSYPIIIQLEAKVLFIIYHNYQLQMNPKKVVKEVLNVARYKTQEPSKTIVDLKQFNGSITDKIISKYRTFMSLNKIEGNNRDFKRSEFSNVVKNNYNQMMELYLKKDQKQMIHYISSPLMDTYKIGLKNGNEFPWNLDENCLNASIVQARVFNDKMTTTFSPRVWYQITCQYNFKNGNKKYHIVQKKINEPFWRFCYFDV